MKKLFFLFVMCFIALTMQAQRYAVLEFQAAQGIHISDVDGISDMFLTYFNPQGYTGVDRGQLNRILAEQNLQHSDVTEEIAVRIGRINNISKVVLGKVSRLGGGYQVDVRVVDVESSRIYAKDGETVTGNFRVGVSALAKRLASKIAIRQSNSVPASSVTPTTSSPRKRTSVETLYGYLKIFPNELGTFQSEPTSVISQINKQAQHGYNNWRIPTNEELSLLKANNYLGSGEYMTRESRQGIVLLVTDGKDYATVKAEEQAKIRAEQERKAEQERRNAQLKAQGLVDLGLPSGTLWKEKNETGGYNNFFTYEEAVSRFGKSLPSKEQLQELMYKCRWTWTGSGYKVTGPNGYSITLPAAGFRHCDGSVSNVGSGGDYWSSTPDSSKDAWYLYFSSDGVYVDSYGGRCLGQSVRLVQD